MERNVSIDENYISEIDRTYHAYVEALGRQNADDKDRWLYSSEGRRFWDAVGEAKTTAWETFAKANGWRFASWAWRSPNWLGRGSNYSSPGRYRDPDERIGSLFDHFKAFSASRRIAALVGQPYMKAEDIPTRRALLAERGFVLHAPPDPFASIHYPGACLFLVVTLPGTVVSWLPDQDGRMTEQWSGRPARAQMPREPTL